MLRNFFLLLLFLAPLSAKEQDEYRVYDEESAEHVKEFYRMNHMYQTVEFVLAKKKEYLPLQRKKMGIWEAIQLLDLLVDDSDPDLPLPQSYHCFQTAEALRADDQPRWLILTGLIHDLGKMLAFYGEPQWAVVGDTFPVGCKWSEKIVFSQYFEANSDFNVPEYQTQYGIYSPACGLDALHMSWGHDEYLYQVVKDYLPEEASFIIRYHSFYALHKEKEYEYFLNDRDREFLPWLQLFSRYDLYSKREEMMELEELIPFYKELVAEFFPELIDW